MKSSRESGSLDGDLYQRVHAFVREALLTNPDIRVEDTIYTSAILIVSLVVVVPVLVLFGNIPLLVIVPIVGLGYCLFIYQTERVYTGLICAFFILAIFNANVPIANGPPKAQLSIYLVDILGITLLVALFYDLDFEYSDSLNYRIGTTAVIGLAIFVLWSYLAALVGNGPSQFSATVFAIQQTRYLMIFAVSILVVARTNVWVGIYPLLLSIAGNLLYAVAEAVSGHTFGLTYLGDGDGPLLSELVIGPWTFLTGSFAGGYVGTTRELIALLLLLLPFLVFWMVYGSRRVTIASALGILGVEFIVRFGETDAGWMSSVLVLTVISGFFLYTSLSSRSLQPLRGFAASLYGVGMSTLLYSERFTGMISSILSDGGGTPNSGEQGTPSPGEQGTPSPDDQGTPNPGEQGTPSPGPNSRNFQDQVVDSLAQVPLIETNTLGIRLTQYAAAVDISLVHPLVGIGGYNFILMSETYDLPSSMGIHNTLFSHLAATGVPGVLAYTISILAVLLLVGREIFCESGKERHFWASIFSGLLGFHAFSFWVVIYGWLTANAGFWALSGIAVGALAFDSSIGHGGSAKD